MKRLKDLFNRQFFRCLVTAVLPVGVVAALGALLTDTSSEWYTGLIKPQIQPPDVLFPVIWSVLYVLVGITLFYACRNGMLKGNRALRWYYVISGVLNVLWSLVFFRLHSPGAALFIILLCFVFALLTTYEFKSVGSWVKFLFIPYIIWIFYASVINYGIVMLN